MHRMCTFRATSCMRWTPLMVPCCIRRWNSFAAGATGAGPADSEAAGSPDMSAVMERAAEARKEIHELWLSMEEMGDRQGRLQQVKELVEKYKLVPSTPREEDVSRGLGDAYDRLLLLCLPLGKAGAQGTDVLESLMHLAGRNGRELSVRTIQHLFSRADSFAEALAVFYAMRRCHVAMNMEAYYAMLYSLQRLEEEGWAQHFHDEAKESGAPSEQAMNFVVRGISGSLLPENKPWVGRIMFQDRDVPVRRYSVREYDELDATWTQRYKTGAAALSSHVN